MDFKVLVLILMVLDICWQMFLNLLDRRSLGRPIPANVRDVYDTESYEKWHAYQTEKSRIGVMQAAVVFIVSFVLICFDCYAGFAALFPGGVYAQLWAVILLETIVSTLAGIPFSAYDIFVVEQKYGFNKRSVGTFIGDLVKELVISLLFLGGLVSLFALIHQQLGDWVILLFAGVIVLVTAIITLLLPVFIRLFNKFTPLEEGELRSRLTDLMERHGYKVRSIDVMDASRRSTKMNAYFTGFGPMKTIVLYDTLLNEMSSDQICAVFAHELGHGLHHDTTKNQLLMAVQGALIAVAVWLIVRTPDAFRCFGFTEVNYGMAFILMGALLAVLKPLMGLLTNHMSRIAEYRADAQAVQEGYAEHLISALKLLAKKNYANLSPDPLLVKLTYSHPTIHERIEAVEKKAPRG